MTLAEQVRACTACPLAFNQEGGAVVVPGWVGPNYQKGGIGIVLDSPGYYEAKAGLPLRGTSGGLFDELAPQAGLSRDDLFVTYVVRHRAPNNRLRDYPEAVSNCAHWTTEELTEYQPSVLVLMGGESIKTVFGADATVARSRGTFAATPVKHPWGWRVVVCTYNPSAAGYQGGADSDIGRLIVNDLKLAQRAAAMLKGVTVAGS